MFLGSVTLLLLLKLQESRPLLLVDILARGVQIIEVPLYIHVHVITIYMYMYIMILHVHV